MTLSGGTLGDSTTMVDGGIDAVAVPLLTGVEGDDGAQPGEGAAEAAARYGIDLAEIADRVGLTGTAGESYVLQLPRAVGSAVSLPWAGLPPRIVLLGVGQNTGPDLRRAGAALARATRGLSRVLTTAGAQPRQSASQAAEAARAFVEGYLLAAYTPPTAAATKPKRAAELVLLGRDGTRASAAVSAARVAAHATWLVRDLATTPSSTKTPAWFAEQAKRLAGRAELAVQVRGPRELAAEGFGGILAVGSGSASTPRLVTVTYAPAG
ncbi:MAG TPA: M17 family peptidase N-terminal domain-containing protein, partial [Cellulomonas sp.]|nr:M17 family peptidase N-terminal domain-containing protein [Cellulomonas sp.]